MAWSQRFVPPIPLPAGGELVTLSDARSYILALSESEQAATKWQTAAGEVLQAASPPGKGPWIDFARIAMMQALYPRDGPRELPQKRRRRTKSYRIIK